MFTGTYSVATINYSLQEIENLQTHKGEKNINDLVQIMFDVLR